MAKAKTAGGTSFNFGANVRSSPRAKTGFSAFKAAKKAKQAAGKKYGGS